MMFTTSRHRAITDPHNSPSTVVFDDIRSWDGHDPGLLENIEDFASIDQDAIDCEKASKFIQFLCGLLSPLVL